MPLKSLRLILTFYNSLMNLVSEFIEATSPFMRERLALRGDRDYKSFSIFDFLCEVNAERRPLSSVRIVVLNLQPGGSSTLELNWGLFLLYSLRESGEAISTVVKDLCRSFIRTCFDSSRGWTVTFLGRVEASISSSKLNS